VMKPLVECVPNFSEGRRLEVVEAISAAVRSVPGVTILDHSSDADHNRSVLTFVGGPDVVEAAAFEGIKKASELIDMTQHSGEHPRIGATDVVPFIPIRGVTMAECVAIARRLGQRVGEELNIPVYFYEAAATRPDRENLADIRKGEYEGLSTAISADPNRAPDFGPAALSKAGATVIGARAPLVAYNVYLNTNDVEAANKIAKSIRHSGGGLRFVKAMGVLVEGRAQVSMNLTDYTKTAIFRAQEMIKREAERYGYMIHHAELVGLIPEQALIDSARWYLQLDQFNDDQILERKLHSTETEAGMIPQAFLAAVASGEPTPGGGSVAALAGALSAALAAMVARATMGKKKYAEVEDAMQDVARSADQLRGELTSAISEDSAAFEEVLTAFRINKEDPKRGEAIQTATRHAAEVPLRAADLALQAMQQLKVVAEHGNINAASDSAAGTHMALAALEAAALNVLVNVQSLEDTSVAGDLRAQITDLRDRGRTLAQEIQGIVENRAGLS
jgi:glutamate formiminotransferase / formiminotetrahydrofolate cyclodeaminase